MRPRTTAALHLVALTVLGLVAGFEREGGRDFHWHLVLGEQTLAHHGWVRTEAFSHTSAGRPVFVSAWAADVALALAFRAGGYGACELLRGLAIAALLVCTWLHARRRGASPVTSTVLAGVLLVGVLPRLFLRPEMFALALGAALLLVLDAYEQAASRTCRRVALGGVLALIVLWANVHGSVVVGLLAVALCSFELAVRRRHDRPALTEVLALPAGALFASCLNPEGLALPLAFRIVSPSFSAHISEWLPLATEHLRAPIVVLGVLAAATTMVAGRRTSPWRLALVVALALVSIRYHRFLSYLLIASIPLIASNVSSLRELVADPRRRRLAAAILVVAGLGFVGTQVRKQGLLARLGIGTQPGVYPEAACAFASGRRWPAHLLNSYDYGGYLLYCLPAQPVFLDQRAWSAYPDELYGEYVAAMASGEALAKLVEDHQIGWAFLSYDDPIASQLASDPERWRLVYFDDEALIYQRHDREELDGFRYLNPLFLPWTLNAPASSWPRLRAELAQQQHQCPSCWRSSLMRAAVAVTTGDDAEFDAAEAALPAAMRARPEMLFLGARRAMAARDFVRAAQIYRRMRTVGGNPIGAATLEADALVKAGDRAGAMKVLAEMARMPGGAAVAARLRGQLGLPAR